MGSSRRARRRRRQARYGKPSYQTGPSNGLHAHKVIFDEAEGLLSVDPGAFTGMAGKVVPMSVGGVGGPRVGTAKVVSSPGDDGLRVSMQTEAPPWPVEELSQGGMSFSFRPVFEEWQADEHA